jgi:predicted nucleic acid-binding protein
VIYLDSSVALAQLLAEECVPRAELWQEPLISSRLLQFEVWNRLHARKLGRSHADLARSLIGSIAFVELVQPVLSRALDPFPTPVRTLDALHLASMDFLRANGQAIELATYDHRLAAAAKALGIDLAKNLV